MIHISERDLQLPDVEFPEIFRRVSSDKKIISLGPGEPDFLTPAPLLAYAKKVIHKATHYSEPQGLMELREAIVKKLERENKIKTDPENIIATCGSQEGIFCALLTAVDPTEQVLVPSPGYVGYIPAIDLVSATPVFVPLSEEDNFELDTDVLRRHIDKHKSKVIILNSPSNPTGNVMSRKVLEEVADIAVEYDLLIFSDEAYENILFEDARHISIGSFNGMHDRVLTFQTFSKSYAMCGFRLGYCAGPKNFIAEMNKDHHYVTLGAPRISQLMGIKALSLPKTHIQKMVKEYKRRRDLIVPRLNSMGLPTKTPKGAFYAFSNISNYSKNSSEFSRDLINKANVAVIPGKEFGPFGEGYIRCSFATEYHKIEEALDRMEKFLKNKGKSKISI
ncbi:pyridoxal phosphate-dependent aminotransferase [Candidatus Pacearchaeota archaeon]|nr:pyridoxal phosphate-dependent aminotransferase [Candidatus Pacearchaeota archaeon]